MARTAITTQTLAIGIVNTQDAQVYEILCAQHKAKDKILHAQHEVCEGMLRARHVYFAMLRARHEVLVMLRARHEDFGKASRAARRLWQCFACSTKS